MRNKWRVKKDWRFFKLIKRDIPKSITFPVGRIVEIISYPSGVHKVCFKTGNHCLITQEALLEHFELV